MTYPDIGIDVAFLKQPLNIELGELGAYLPPVTWLSQQVRGFNLCPFNLI